MNALIDATLRVSIVIAVALLATAVMRRRAASLRHAAVASALVLSACVVPLSWMLPSWPVALPAWLSASRLTDLASGTVDVRLSSASAASGADGFTVDVLCGLVWLTGTVGSLGAVAAALIRLRRIARRSVPLVSGPWRAALDVLAAEAGIGRPVTLLESHTRDLLATWGTRRPCIVLPAGSGGWSADRVRAVLRHELAHIRRHDWLVQVSADVLCAWQWFNPLCWIALRRLREYGEMACDDEALRDGGSPREYALCLVEITRSCRPTSLPAVVPMARPTGFERRITAMLNPEIDRRPVSRGLAAALFVALSLVIAPAAALTSAQATPPTPPAAVPSSTTLKVGGSVKPPKKIHDVQPVYPEAMLDAGIAGNIELEVTIGKDGGVRKVHVLTTDVHPDLAVAAVDAVRQWKFEPTLLNGAPVDVMMKCTVAFKLD